jgi:hypothetical protein
VGTDAGVALNARRRKEATLKTKSFGIVVVHGTSQPPGNGSVSPKSRSTSARKPTTPTATRSRRR